jgi:integrase
MKGRRKVIPRRRNLSFDELCELVHVRLPAVPNAPVMVAALRLILATGCRPGEVLGARWEWYDRRAGILKLPAEATKNRRPHAVPLSDYALARLAALETIRQCEFICPAARRPLAGRERSPAIRPRADTYARGVSRQVRFGQATAEGKEAARPAHVDSDATFRAGRRSLAAA